MSIAWQVWVCVETLKLFLYALDSVIATSKTPLTVYNNNRCELNIVRFDVWCGATRFGVNKL